MTPTRTLTLLTSVLLTLCLTGCSGTHAGKETHASKEGPGMSKPTTIAEAKAETQKMEKEIISLIPPEYIGEVDQQETGTFLRCQAEGDVVWAGGANITVAGEPDFPTLLKEMQTVFDRREGFRTFMRETDHEVDNIDLEIRNEHGAMWSIGPFTRGTEFFLTSFSSCVPLPKDMWIREKY